MYDFITYFSKILPLTRTAYSMRTPLTRRFHNNRSLPLECTHSISTVGPRLRAAGVPTARATGLAFRRDSVGDRVCRRLAERVPYIRMLAFRWVKLILQVAFQRRGHLLATHGVNWMYCRYPDPSVRTMLYNL